MICALVSLAVCGTRGHTTHLRVASRAPGGKYSRVERTVLSLNLSQKRDQIAMIQVFERIVLFVKHNYK